MRLSTGARTTVVVTAVLAYALVCISIFLRLMPPAR